MQDLTGGGTPDDPRYHDRLDESMFELLKKQNIQCTQFPSRCLRLGVEPAVTTGTTSRAGSRGSGNVKMNLILVAECTLISCSSAGM